MELCQLICCSLKHYSLFNTMKTEVSTATQTLKPLCPTHWTVCTKAIDAIVQNNSVLKDVLCEINSAGRGDYALKAGGYVNTMETSAAFLD